MNGDAVWITGVGAATPLGTSYREIADNLLAGKSGIVAVDRFQVKDHLSQIAGLVANIPDTEGFDRKTVDQQGSTDSLALHCASQALRDSGLWDARDKLRVGFVLGSAADWNSFWEADYHQGGRRILQTMTGVRSLVHRVAALLGTSGPTVSLSAACASGNYALGMAKRWIELGWCDVCIAGGCDMAITPTTLACFGNLRALSKRNGEPQRASRPFDVDRDGFVISEGGALFVLESATRARKRSAHAYAQVAGYGGSSDAFHMVIPNNDPGPAIAAVRSALADAKMDPADVHYVNAHATSTPVGDAAEAKVLETVFGSHIPNLPVSSTKSMSGHLLTAAAAFEALACIVAFESQAVPPTINLENPDPECRLCHVPNHAQERKAKTAISNSFGFGGSNTSLVLRSV
ncbi:MAG: beta-ketoacyl-[acyl-carrier-protein] synthase family protein [Gemmataceae bacterium]|nr:beta-ketoacyl-[acyl-carrier-protein] synthase family protein [Gemmataceae bacterium]